MAYTSPSTRSTGDIITAAIWNQDVVSNSQASVPDIFTTAGDIVYATAADTAARLGATGNGSKVLRMNSGATAPEYWALETATGVLHDTSTRAASGTGAYADITGLTVNITTTFISVVLAVVSFRKKRTGANGPGATQLVIDGTAQQNDSTIDPGVGGSEHVTLVGRKAAVAAGTVTTKLQFNGTDVDHAAEYYNTSILVFTSPS